MNLTQAFLSSPGPKNLKEAAVLYLKGFTMGAADIIPGVSGGTVAFIAGIYTELVDAIKSIDLEGVKKLLRFDLKGVLAHVHLKFLLVLVSGIATALVSAVRLVHFLLENYPVYTWATFFGMIGASTVILGQKFHWQRPGNLVSMLLGVVAGYLIVGLIPVQTPQDWWFLFVCGAIAICAMILPGISGAFLLVVLGKYEYVTGALKDPFSLESLVIIFSFGAGALLGITSFSRVLSYLLHHYEALTLAALTGLMAGSLRKVWPWKDTLEVQWINGKLTVLRDQNVLPQMDGQFFVALGLAGLGLAFVLVMEKIAATK